MKPLHNTLFRWKRSLILKKSTFLFVSSLLVVFQFFNTDVKAQVPTVQDCMEAIPICNFIYHEDNAYQGTGNYPNEINNSYSCLGSGEKNDVWYVFTVQSTGTLNFSITPNNMNDDYDWAVYNLTENDCEDIYTHPEIEVSCDYSGTPGITGPNGMSGDQNEPTVAVTIGETYVINVSQFSSSYAGYTIDFSASTAVIFDDVPPQFQKVIIPTYCGGNIVEVKFTESVQCSSVHATDFQITGPGAPFIIQNISSQQCELGGSYDNKFYLTLNHPISMGTYAVQFTPAPGSAIDNCGNSASSVTKTFSATSPIGLTYDFLNITCNNYNNGSIQIFLEDTSGVVNYSINNGVTFVQNGGNFQNLAAGTYKVYVNDANNCPKTGPTITITNPPLLVIDSVKVTDITCYNSNNGNIKIFANGGTGTKKYSINSGSFFTTLNNFSNLLAGQYPIVIKDNNSCQTVGNIVTITNPQELITNNITNNVKCFGEPSGSILLTSQGGKPLYTYKLNNTTTSTLGRFENLSAGTYNISITDMRNCVKNKTLTITQPDSISVSATQQNNLCYGNSLGNINLNVIGGVPAYQFEWSNSVMSQNLQNIAAGNYSVTVTDANNCTKTKNYIITQKPEIVINETITNILCKGENTGAVQLQVQGGVPAYNYNWSNGSNTANLQNIAAGAYNIKVTDANLCIKEKTFFVEEPQYKLTVNDLIINHVDCYANSTASILLQASGGTYPLNIQWNNGQTDYYLQNLSAGNYTFTLTDSNNCTIDSTIQIQQPAAPLQIAFAAEHNTCKSGNMGAIDLTVTGGVAPYIYEWSNSEQTEDVENLRAGSYSVTVTDANNCTQSLVFQINEPTEILSISHTANNVLCYGGNEGSATVTATGGTPEYKILWSSGDTTFTVSELTAGLYSYTVTDSLMCSKTNVLEINSQKLSLKNTQFIITPISCFGEADGKIETLEAGGTAPYQFIWNNTISEKNIFNLAKGYYELKITDSNNCQLDTTVYVSAPDTSLYSEKITNHVSCYNGTNASVTMQPAGGTAPYSVLWSDGSFQKNLQNVSAGIYSYILTDAHNCKFYDTLTITQPDTSIYFSFEIDSISCKGGKNGSIALEILGGTPQYFVEWNNNSNGNIITDLSAGIYEATITDLNGCEISSEIELTEPIFELKFNKFISFDAPCKNLPGGWINVETSGGVPPYNFLWSNGTTTEDGLALSAGTYQLIAEDANNCIIDTFAIIQEPQTAMLLSSSSISVDCGLGNNGSINLEVTAGNPPYSYLWSNNALTQDLTNLTAGDYTATVTDSHNCTEQITTTVNESMVVEYETENVKCFGENNGSVELSISGGLPPYYILWENGSNATTRTNLAAGTYSVTVTDNSGCNSSYEIEIEQATYQLNVTLKTQQVLCNSASTGFADLEAYGGTQPYSFQWNTGATTEDLQNISAGNYSVQVFDANNCLADTSFTILQVETPLSFQFIKNDVSCYGSKNGNIQVITSGGTPNYEYFWQHGNFGNYITNLDTGYYYLTVQDFNNCTTHDSIYISQPDTSIFYSFEVTHNHCYNAENGSINLTINGGTAPYNFVWSNNSTNEDLQNIKAGIYQFTIIDSKGCTTNGSAVVEQPLSIETNVIIEIPTCYNYENGKIELQPSGGILPYTCLWNDGNSGLLRNNITAGTYIATISDAQNCTTVDTIEVLQPTELTVELIVTDIGCIGSNTGKIETAVNGGTPNYFYTWSNGEHSTAINNLFPGNYWVTVLDNNGCENQKFATITEPETAISINEEIVNVSCFGMSDGAINLTVTGGSPTYNYLWSNGATTASNENLVSGSYAVLVTDGKNCTVAANYFISEPLSLQMQLFPVNAKCFGSIDGSINSLVYGGNGNYSYLWSSGQQTAAIDKVPAGVYTLTVTDSKQCSKEKDTVIHEPEALATEFEIFHPDCFSMYSGAANVTVTGGTPNYSYLWSTGAQSPYISGLSAGVYSLIVTDNNLCNDTSFIEISAINSFQLEVEKTDVTCWGESNGEIFVTTIGGQAPFEIEWSNNNEDFENQNLSSGMYSIVVEDANGCLASDTIIIETPLALNIQSTTSIACNNTNNGKIDLTVYGGTPPFAYQWSNGSETEDLTDISEGTYSVTITDSNLCNSFSTFTLQAPTALLLEAVSKNSSCPEKSDGEIEIFVTGGIPPYNYNWTGFSSQSSFIETLSSGFYSIVVTDLNNCSVSSEIEITDLYEVCISASNAFTPNGDGINDSWEIIGIENFPSAEIEIFDRFGTLVAKYSGSDEAWNGFYGNEILPVDSYYYFINFNDELLPPIKGIVTLVR